MSVGQNTTVWLTATGSVELLRGGGGSGNKNTTANYQIETAPLGKAGRWAALLMDHPHRRRAGAVDCRTIEVHTGDSCGSLATKCGVTGADFTRFNNKPDLCSTLAEGQHVCCSAGTLPDFAPKPNADGSCATYQIQAGEGCSAIAAKFSLTIAKLESFNKETWGWPTCDRYMVVNQVICVSAGSPPMPSPIDNAQCGPQVPGTQRPTGGDFDLSKLNPCPLNVCCDIWGQCGTTDEFCVDNRGDGAPGTAAKGTNGCISNCGTDIVAGDSPPSEYRSVGYFEAWNHNRPCLWMEATDIDPAQYTHIHFAFARLKDDFSIDVAYVQRQFDTFKKLSSFKKVLAFGGWSDSTSPESFMALRKMVLPENRDKVAQNMADFISVNALDGVDIDWEYPGEPDIAGIPAASETEGLDYLKFLATLKGKLPAGTTLSIAAPASYWYLKQFPIDRMAKVLDYLVLMTYDLHGQWDAGNQWSDPGCPEGNCLRSHVNRTETLNALAMVTKAGVPANKVVVGVASYGRSFKMTRAGCTGPQCTFEGDARNSKAKPGVCMRTAGYISQAEIDQILANDKSARQYVDDDSDSNILVYGETEWVAFMSGKTRASRERTYKGYNFGGTAEWAVDLRAFQATEGALPGIFVEISEHNGMCPWKFPAIDCLNPGVVYSIELTRAQRWHNVSADCAWHDFLAYWNTAGRESWPLRSSHAMERFFGGTESFDCQFLKDDNDCNSDHVCNEYQLEGSSGPGGWFVLQSAGNINVAFFRFHEAISAAQNDMNSVLEDFKDDFYPDGDMLALILDIVGIALAVVLPLALDVVFGVSNFVQSVTYASYPFVLATLYDSGAAETAISQASPGGQLLDVTNAWKQTLEETVKRMFNGTSTSQTMLTELIRDGQQIQGSDQPVQPDKGTMTTAVGTALLGTLIPNSWRINGYNPVVLSTGKPCGTVGPYDNKYMEPETGTNSWTCVEGEIYYLLGATGKFVDATACECHSGEDKLDGGRWNGITRESIVRWAIATSKLSGKPMDVNDPEAYKNLISNDSRRPVGPDAPGIVAIPVCNIDKAFENWRRGSQDDNPNYPCDKPRNQ
ncbi:hypothetical protein VTK73DRAFT_4511 [Phialemonium thermophilum]|uniref:chitinase n=1 Tax=Phialemonium thermophilum TaxID=223376 RepID=A0ABR3WTN6_9PEZI